MVTFYSGATEAGNVEHSNYKFGLDKTLSILFKSAEVSLLGSPLLIGFGLGFAEAKVLVQIKVFLRSSVPRGKAGRLFLLAFFFWQKLHEASEQSRVPQSSFVPVGWAVPGSIVLFRALISSRHWGVTASSGPMN